jgi:large subunit ribosomal protein L29
MKPKELRKKTKEELSTLLVELTKEKFNLKMQKATGQLARPSQVVKVRRNIARVYTIIDEMAKL